MHTHAPGSHFRRPGCTSSANDVQPTGRFSPILRPALHIILANHSNGSAPPKLRSAELGSGCKKAISELSFNFPFSIRESRGRTLVACSQAENESVPFSDSRDEVDHVFMKAQ
jgi:hypothetical protein